VASATSVVEDDTASPEPRSGHVDEALDVLWRRKKSLIKESLLLSLSLCLSVSLSLCLSVSLSHCLCVCVCLSLSLSHTLTHTKKYLPD
jgi:hypothetical protein